MQRRVLAVNVNDFGGKTGHLMSHRYFNNRDRKYHIDWKYWAEQNDKTEIWEEWKRYAFCASQWPLVRLPVATWRYEWPEVNRLLCVRS